MEGSSHTMTTEPLPGDSIIQVEMKHLNEGNSHSNNNVPTPIHSSMITDTSIPKELLDNIKKGTSDRRTNGNIKIPRVPLWLKNEANKKCFEPALVSIGPYHHNNLESSRIQELKITAAQRLVIGCGGPSIDEDCKKVYSKVKSVSDAAMKYYDEEFISSLDKEAFTIMMFLDGCFVVDFIYHVMFGGSFDELLALGNDMHFIFRDLFLLENQLPYPVLKVLMDFKKGPEYLCGSESIIDSYVDEEVDENFGIFSLRLTKNHEPYHILDLFLTKLVGDDPSHDEHESTSYGLSRSYPPVNELLDKGITFKTNDFGGLCDVEFKSNMFNGELSLPILKINHSTKDRFLNLIAYELSSDLRSDHAFISFICFLDTLIDHADDVKLLRSADIIYNYLGSDEDVAKLVNQLAIGLGHNLSAYSKVICGIRKYCKDKRKVYIGEFVHTHCRNPWKIIALIAACSIIFLTGIQTFYAVFPP